MKRRVLLKMAPAALALGPVPAVAARPVADDPIIGYASRWSDALDIWLEAAARTDGGNFDLPIHLEMDEIKDAMIERMKETPITTAAGFAAFCDYVHRDQHFGDEAEQYPEMQRWQWDKIKAWAEACVSIGGVA